MQIAFVLYPDFTALDIIGPFQTLASVPGHDATFVASRPGPISDDTGCCSITATAAFGDVTRPDIVVIGGGIADTDPDPTIRPSNASERE